MIDFLKMFWGDIVTVVLMLVGVILGVIVYFWGYRPNKVIAKLPKLPTVISCGLFGGLIGFILGALLEDSIDKLVGK